ncbi:hypothetical protein OPKNFCMD_5578 [Methylobacterium crusticola]|uniref:Uncharacterized protein n=1 Tax=Methylobacterium crusticola TaxID=1697972 RepID=A0ABQ4R673_9HYPH|nr:hypothetical protein [Methylobacterium crusticola]GJD52811.1 hypothetical protein OPKNFCMD_5578 [Methylobacterium crusticola]
MAALVDGVLLAALAGTSACVVPMYLKLKRLDRTQAEYGRAMAASGRALASAGEAVRGFTGEGREVLDALSLKIEEARAVLAALEAGRRETAAAGDGTPGALARAEEGTPGALARAGEDARAAAPPTASDQPGRVSA